MHYRLSKFYQKFGQNLPVWAGINGNTFNQAWMMYLSILLQQSSTVPKTATSRYIRWANILPTNGNT